MEIQTLTTRAFGKTIIRTKARVTDWQEHRVRQKAGRPGAPDLGARAIRPNNYNTKIFSDRNPTVFKSAAVFCIEILIFATFYREKIMNKKNADKEGQFPEYSGMHLPAIDTEILTFWEREAIFEKSTGEREAGSLIFFMRARRASTRYRGFIM